MNTRDFLHYLNNKLTIVQGNLMLIDTNDYKTIVKLKRIIKEMSEEINKYRERVIDEQNIHNEG